MGTWVRGWAGGCWNIQQTPTALSVYGIIYSLYTSTCSVSAEKCQHTARLAGSTVGITGNKARRKYPVSVPEFRTGHPGVGLFVVRGLGSTSWWDESTGVAPTRPLTLTPSQRRNGPIWARNGAAPHPHRKGKKPPRKFHNLELQAVPAVCRKKYLWLIYPNQ